MDIINMTWVLIRNGNPVYDCVELGLLMLIERYVRGSEVTITRTTAEL